MPFSWLRTRRRNRLAAQPFPYEWRDVLTRRVRHFQYLNSDQRLRLEDFVQVFVAEKDWVPTGDVKLTDEVRVTIAGYAGVMTIGLPEPYYFDRLLTVIVDDDAYRPAGVERRGYLVGRPGPRFGETLQTGPIKLSWQEIVDPRRLQPGSNLVIHEFAHHVDGLDGEMDGIPAVGRPAQRRAWQQVVGEEFARLRSEVAQGQSTLLDPYGATNRAEFFAVASECFFERPQAMRDEHGVLYQLFGDFYCQDPSAWLPNAPGADG